MHMGPAVADTGTEIREQPAFTDIQIEQGVGHQTGRLATPIALCGHSGGGKPMVIHVPVIAFKFHPEAVTQTVTNRAYADSTCFPSVASARHVMSQTDLLVLIESRTTLTRNIQTLHRLGGSSGGQSEDDKRRRQD